MSQSQLIAAANETFPGFQQKNQVNLYYFMGFMRNFAQSLSIYKRILSIIGVFVTILHIYILSRKSLGKSSTNMIMIGLAICDIGLMCITIIGFIQELLGRTQLSCNGPLTYIETYFLIILLIFGDFCRRCTSWLAIMMTAIRVIVVKHAASLHTGYFSSSKCGKHTIASIFILSSVFAVFQHFIYGIDTENDDWTPSKNCLETSVQSNITPIVYYIYEDTDYGPLYIVMNGVIAKIVPCVAFPILTAILIGELRQSEIIRKASITSESSGKYERTTALVAFIAIIFCISEFPQGVLKFIEFYYYDSLGFMYITSYAGQMFSLVSLINALSHGIICYAMSITYRNTFKSIFGCLKAKKSRSSSTVSVVHVNTTKGFF